MAAFVRPPSESCGTAQQSCFFLHGPYSVEMGAAPMTTRFSEKCGHNNLTINVRESLRNVIDASLMATRRHVAKLLRSA